MAFTATESQDCFSGDKLRHAPPQNFVARARAFNASRIGFRIKRVKVGFSSHGVVLTG
jgi:hypothetical protein